MSHVQAKPLPGPFVLFGSLAIGFHLFALVILVLAAPSGPWPIPFGPGSSPAEPPHFADAISRNLIVPCYLDPLRMTHNYHFETNNVDVPQVYFEARLKDRQGNLITTVKYPDDRANFWVRHRQGLLVQGLVEDQPLQAPQQERIPSPKIKIWHLVEERTRDALSGPVQEELVVYRQAEMLEVRLRDLLRQRPASRPNELALLLAKSYMRYLCREHGAASGELTRYSRQAVGPETLILPEARIPPGTFTKMIAHYGEYSADRDDFKIEEVSP